MVIIETRIFSRRIKELMGDDEYHNLQEALVNRPDLGAIIQGAGGLSSLEAAGPRKERSVRVIYYWMTEDEQIYMLHVYPKNSQEDLTSAQKKTLKTIVERWSDEK